MFQLPPRKISNHKGATLAPALRSTPRCVGVQRGWGCRDIWWHSGHPPLSLLASSLLLLPGGAGHAALPPWVAIPTRLLPVPKPVQKHLGGAHLCTELSAFSACILHGSDPGSPSG